ncbi:transmembrane protein, putative [Bodo saltans]|uniref:Transmembrane protein, putative n=1 Tax=Bodo saltans TaxID=75058 RepID=A0A0S4IIE9_BODSA|nr:transmembrane protein, putative [Bodo saltans]|eukprot:CUE71590.1 transmembrane protein, putative [Bodo saltans]
MKHNYDSPSTPGKGSPAGGFSATPQGSIKSSLVALPFWYQLLSIILSALIPFFLNDFALLSWASHQLHFDFGTSTLWTSSRGSHTYFDMVNSMSIRERLGFAVYATFVLGVVFAITRSIYPASLQQLPQSPSNSKIQQQRSSSSKPLSRSDLNDSRFDTSTATLRLMHQYLLFPKLPKLEKFFFVLNIGEALLVVKHIITECVESPQFATFITTTHLHEGEIVDITTTYEAVRFILHAIHLDAHAHVMVQLDIVLRLLTWWGSSVVVPVAFVFLYRLLRDARNRHVHSLRWYALWLAVARSSYVLVPLLVSSGSPEREAFGNAVWHFLWGNTSHFASIWLHPHVWSVVVMLLRGILLVAAVNYVYGPSRRSSFATSAASRRAFVASAMSTAARSAFVPLIASFLVLGIAVGVHIVELLLLWVFTFMALIWIPTALDSGSQELMCFISVVATCVNEVAPPSAPTVTAAAQKFFVSTDCVTFAFACFSALLATSTMLNVGCAVFGSRGSSLMMFLLTVLVMTFGFTYAMTIQDVSATLSYFTRWLPQIVVDAAVRVVMIPHAAATTQLPALSATQLTWLISGVCLAITLTCALVNTLLEHRFLSSQRRENQSAGIGGAPNWSRRSRSGKYVMCTALTLCKRSLWLIAQLANVVASTICGIVLCRICAAFHLPLGTETWLAVCVGIACFGAMTDMIHHEYQFLLRVFGLCDPPVGTASERSSSGLNDDSSEIADGA